MRTLSGFLALTSVLAIGCGDPGNATPDSQSVDIAIGGGAFSVSGSVVGNVATIDTAYVAWIVGPSLQDYPYKFGQGPSSPSEFMVSFTSDPPAGAINADGVGVGLVVIPVAGIAVPPDGVIDEQLLNSAGLSGLHTIVFKTPTATPVDWKSTFPTGYACGECVSSTRGGFDTFQVTPCTNLVVEIPPIHGCNWM